MPCDSIVTKINNTISIEYENRAFKKEVIVCYCCYTHSSYEIPVHCTEYCFNCFCVYVTARHVVFVFTSHQRPLIQYVIKTILVAK